MNKQLIIAIGGEYGAGAHVIAERLAEEYNIPLYDARILQYIAEEKNIDIEKIQKFDEMMKNRLFSRTVSGFSSSPEETVAQMEFDFLKEKAANGNSFIVVNRCANSLLSSYEGLVSIFVTSDMQHKADFFCKLFRRTTAFFVFFAASAWARVIRTNLFALSYRFSLNAFVCAC